MGVESERGEGGEEEENEEFCPSNPNTFMVGRTLAIPIYIYITIYGSTLYIGMDEVLAHYACTFENSNLHFHFQ